MIMKLWNLGKGLLTLSVIWTSTNSIAGHSGALGGSIHNLKVHKTSGMPVVMFTTIPHVSPPMCGDKEALEWAITLDDFGKSVYSLLLSAQAQQKRVIIHGKHTCEDWGDRESIVHITLAD
ncbi:hypothetical protein [Vibrio sp. TRT 17S01]|uniref:hypothetical protein n=1 Tax=Vibrio sp. TRT 17S01 TaxID=3418505 RepID=UPI003CFB5E65